jgi:hypothetical protein
MSEGLVPVKYQAGEGCVASGLMFANVSHGITPTNGGFWLRHLAVRSGRMRGIAIALRPASPVPGTEHVAVERRASSVEGVRRTSYVVDI